MTNITMYDLPLNVNFIDEEPPFSRNTVYCNKVMIINFMVMTMIISLLQVWRIRLQVTDNLLLR